MRMFLNNFHYALLKIRYAETIAIFERFIALSLSGLFLFLFGQNLWAVLSALLISETSALILLGIAAFKYWDGPSLPKHMLNQKSIRSMALNFWGTDLLTYGLSIQAAVLLISLLLADNAQIAFYSIGTNLLSQITAVAVSNWKNVPLPALSQARVSKGDQGIIQGWQLFLKLFSFALMPVLFFLLFNAEPLVSLLYGEGYLYSARIMQIGASFFIIALASGFWSTIGALYTLDAQNALLRLRIWTGLGNIILIVILIPLIGIWGAAIASPLAASIGNWFEFMLLRRYLNVRIPWRFIGFLSLSGLISGAASLIIPSSTWFELIARTGIYGTIFVLLLFISKPLEIEEAMMARKFVPKFSYFINLISRTYPKGAIPSA